MVVQQIPRNEVTPTDFFRRVVASDGKYVVAFFENGKLKHKVFDVYQEAVDFSLQKTFLKCDTYFALATYKQGFHQSPDGKMVLRTQSNAKSMKSLFVDIDVGDKKSYSTQGEAINGLRKFCDNTGVPAPSCLISSGSGLHAYWTLNVSMDTAKWQPLATALKDAALAKGFKIDPAVTGDAARILRLPGTLNFKNPDKPERVEVIYMLTEDYDPQELHKALAPWVDVLPSMADSELAGLAEEDNQDLTRNVGSVEPIYMKYIVQRCAVMKQIADTHGAECEEPLWTATLQLAKICEDGTDWIHPLSDGHPGYSLAATEKKFQERLHNPFGGTRCKTFEQYMPEACKTCPHYGKLNSPAGIGRKEYDDPFGIPRPYRNNYTDMCIEKYVRSKKKDEDGGEYKYVLPFVAEDAELFKKSNSNGYIFCFTIKNKSRSHRVTVDTELFGDTRSLGMVFGECAFALIGKDDKYNVVKLMESWIDKLVEIKAAKRDVAAMGWQPDKSFYTGYYLVPSMDVIPPRVEYQAYAGKHEPKGSLDNWKKGPAVLVKQGHQPLLTILATAFAAPLMPFTGEKGFLVSAVSERSGVGKSTAIAMAQGVWASPSAVNSLDDTENAIIHKLGFLNNLPAYWDEIKGTHSLDQMIRVAFRLSEGRSKARLTQSARLRETLDWRTIMVAASNSSLIDHIAASDIHTDAGIMRVFEFSFDIDHKREDIPDPYLIENNYGHAGIEYAKYLAENAKRIPNDIAHIREQFRTRFNIDKSERFWLAAMTCLMVGAVYAKTVGLVNFDLQKLSDYLGDTLTVMRTKHIDHNSSRSPEEVLALYVTDNFSERLVTNVLGTQHKKEVQCVYLPARNIPIVQIANNDKRLLIQCSNFKDWLKKRGYPASLARTIDGLPIASKVKRQLGAYTPHSGPKVWLWEIDISTDPTLESLITS